MLMRQMLAFHSKYKHFIVDRWNNKAIINIYIQSRGVEVQNSIITSNLTVSTNINLLLPLNRHMKWRVPFGLLQTLQKKKL